MLNQLLTNQIFLIGISTVFAAIPAAIWIYLMFHKSEKSRKTIALIFFLGCLTAPILLGIQYLWEVFPSFDIAALIETSIKTQSTMYILMFMLFGAMEEIIKHFAVNQVDKRTLLVKRIGDAMRYSIAAALGFSFIENIYYLYEFWNQISIGGLVGMYIFRSTFTTCAHMIFSGIFGYHYGIGKFSIDISEQEKLSGETSRITKIISKIFKIPLSHAYQQKMVIKGLGLAVGMHVFYNYLLQFNIVLPIIIFVALGYIYLRYLLKRKTGNLILTTDISTKQKSTLPKKDEEVVLELMGLWFEDKRYTDVIHVCERLLERDPDNNVVKLFKAKALDRLNDKDVYKKIIKTVLRSKDEITERDHNVISKYLDEKEKLR